MHTYKGKETIFNYNSDLSGQVIVITDKGETEISGQDLIDFITDCYILPQKVKSLNGPYTSKIIFIKVEELIRND